MLRPLKITKLLTLVSAIIVLSGCNTESQATNHTSMNSDLSVIPKEKLLSVSKTMRSQATMGPSGWMMDWDIDKNGKYNGTLL